MNPPQPFDLRDAEAAYWARRDARTGGRRASDRPSDDQWLLDLEQRVSTQMAERHPDENREHAAA